MPRTSKRHDQRGMSLGECPDCGQQMWKDQKTVNVPIKIGDKWHGCLMHQECADKDL